MRIRIKWWDVGISDGGYRHIILLGLSYGLDGALIQLPFCRIEVTWGLAAKLQKQEHYSNSSLY